MAQADSLDWYPGHCYVETAVFEQDPTTKVIGLKEANHIVHKRDLPNDSEKEKVKFSFDHFQTAIEHVPNGCLQLIRFVGLTRDAPVTAQTHQDRKVLASTFAQLKLPTSGVAFALSSPRVELGRLLAGDEDELETKTPTFSASGSRLSAIWRFDSNTKSTRLVIVNYAPPSAELAAGFTGAMGVGMQSFKRCFGHPMFISIILAYFLRLDIMTLYDQDSTVLSAIESQVTLKSAKRISTMQQLRDLGRLVGQDKFILYALKVCLEQARIFNERTFADKDGNFKDPISRHFRANLEHQLDLLGLDSTFIESMQESINHQQNAISTIVNMQDSASMKTIAVITMAFLPGTFLASIFAMPTFPKGDDYAFWLYWAVCIPLTALVFIAWLAWFYWHTINKYYDDPREHPLQDLKTWWKEFNDPEISRSKTAAHDLVRRRLAGDTYKDWMSGFYNTKHRSGGQVSLGPATYTAGVTQPV